MSRARIAALQAELTQLLAAERAAHFLQVRAARQRDSIILAAQSRATLKTLKLRLKTERLNPLQARTLARELHTARAAYTRATQALRYLKRCGQ